MTAIRFYCLLPTAPSGDIRGVPFRVPPLRPLPLRGPLSTLSVSSPFFPRKGGIDNFGGDVSFPDGGDHRALYLNL